MSNNKYSVALVFVKPSQDTNNVHINVKLAHLIIIASSKEEALGMAIEDLEEETKGFELNSKNIIKIP